MNRVRYPLVPQRVAPNAILLFLPVKFKIRKKSATKFLCVKTFSGKVVATSFHYQTVVGRDRGMVRSCDPLKILGAPIISLERLNLKS